jgi:hypothetical protein
VRRLSVISHVVLQAAQFDGEPAMDLNSYNFAFSPEGN